MCPRTCAADALRNLERLGVRVVARLQARVDRHLAPEAEAPPQPHGVRGGMDLPADELQPAKHQTGVVAGEAEAGGKDEEQEEEEVADQ